MGVRHRVVVHPQDPSSQAEVEEVLHLVVQDNCAWKAMASSWLQVDLGVVEEVHTLVPEEDDIRDDYRIHWLGIRRHRYHRSMDPDGTLDHGRLHKVVVAEHVHLHWVHQGMDAVVAGIGDHVVEGQC